MRIPRIAFMGAGLAVLLGAGGCLSHIKTAPQEVLGAGADRRALAKATIGEWSEFSSKTARLFMDEYGVPDEVRSGSLVWINNGPWRRTIVRDVRPSYVEGDDLGVIEQTIDAALTPAQAAEISAFDSRVRYDAVTRYLSASSDREALNLLRLNLASDVAAERLTGEQARLSYARIVEFEASGKTSPYMLSLRSGPAPKP
jgi:hypothetical protein